MITSGYERTMHIGYTCGLTRKERRNARKNGLVRFDMSLKIDIFAG